MTVSYPNLCYNQVYYKGTALNHKFTLTNKILKSRKLATNVNMEIWADPEGGVVCVCVCVGGTGVPGPHEKSQKYIVS